MDAKLQESTVIEYVGDRSLQQNFHGRGKAVFSSGQVYDGDWQHGHMHGQGSINFPDGIMYQGCMSGDSITGTGVYCWGNAVYEGEVLGGFRHGHGTLCFTDSPEVYEGQWYQGKRHGTGVLYYNPERTAFYEGDWHDDMKHGEGTSVYTSGNTYTGSWAQDKRQGIGTMSWCTLGQRYTGSWLDGLPNGLGEHIWEQHCLVGTASQLPNHAMHVKHNRYFGMFKDGQRHGEGTLFYSNGARYEGQWQEGKKHGQGVYVFEEGTIFCGQFVEDRPDMSSGLMVGSASTFSPDCSSRAGAASPSIQAAAARDGSSTGGSGEEGTETGTKAAAQQKSMPSKTASNRQRNKKVGSLPPGDPDSPAATSVTAAADAAAGAVTPSAAAPPASTPRAGAFGPVVSTMQLYIADLLQEYDASPVATYKAVANLLTGFNTELRTLYDKYCTRQCPLIDPAMMRTSWALQAGQLWELARDSQLLCRHVQLHTVCQLTQQAITPPAVVLQRRQEVLPTPDGIAVLQQPPHLYDPCTELLFRDFCEVMVRLSAARYPLLPALELQLQQVLSYHLLPLLSGPGRPLAGGTRTAMLAAGNATSAAAAAGGGGGGGNNAGGLDGASRGNTAGLAAGCEQSDEFVSYVQSRLMPLQQLYAAFAGPDIYGVPIHHQQQQQQCPGGALVDGCDDTAAAGPAEPPAAVDEAASVLWKQHAVTVHQVVVALQEAGLLQQWCVADADAASALLHDVLSVKDPTGARACIEVEPGDLGAPDFGPDDSMSCNQLSPRSNGNQGADAALQQDLLFWMDCPLLLQELLWGLAHLAELLPAEQTLQLPPQHQQQDKPLGCPQQLPAGAQLPAGGCTIAAAAPTSRLRLLVEGKHGLFAKFLGSAAVSGMPDGAVHDDQYDGLSCVCMSRSESPMQQITHRECGPEGDVAGDGNVELLEA